MTATCTAHKSTYVRPERFVSWLTRDEGGCGVLQIRLVHKSGREETDLYYVTPFCDDMTGRTAFQLERFDAPHDNEHSEAGIAGTYRCYPAFGRERGLCTCDAGKHNLACKHIGAIEMLAQKGQL